MQIGSGPVKMKENRKLK